MRNGRESILPLFHNTFVSLSLLLATTCACERPVPAPDTLTLAIASAPEAIDPRFATSAVAMRLSSLVAAPLVIIGDDLRPQPFLAESLSWPDERTLVVRVRDGLRFHDNTPLRAHDVVATFLSMKDPTVRSPHRPKLERLREITALDERTVRFEFDAPFPAFVVDLNGYGIVAAACVRDAERCRHAPIGAGPYRVAAPLDERERLRLEAHDDGPVAAPRIRAIEVRVIRDNTTRLLELLDGGIDLVVGDLLPTDLDAVTKATYANRALQIQTAPGVGFSYLALNVRDAPLADARVRRAIAHAIDVDTVIATKLRGRARRASGLMPARHWASDDAITPLAFDPDRARALLDEAGYPPNEDGIRFSITLMTTTDRLRRSVALIFADALSQVGINVEIAVRDWPALYQDIQKGAFDAFSAKWTPVIDPDLMHWVYHSTSIPTDARAGGNRSGYANAVVDEALDRGRGLVDESARAAAYKSIAPLLREEVPLVPLWFEDEVAVHSSALEDFTLVSTASLLPIASAQLKRTPR